MSNLVISLSSSSSACLPNMFFYVFVMLSFFPIMRILTSEIWFRNRDHWEVASSRSRSSRGRAEEEWNNNSNRKALPHSQFSSTAVGKELNKLYLSYNSFFLKTFNSYNMCIPALFSTLHYSSTAAYGASSGDESGAKRNSFTIHLMVLKFCCSPASHPSDPMRDEPSPGKRNRARERSGNGGDFLIEIWE